MIRNLKLNKKAAAILLAASMSCGLVGCGETEMSSPNIYDTIDTNTDSDSLTNGYRQVKSVDGEDFDLVIDFDVEDRKGLIQHIKKKVEGEFLEYNIDITLDNDISD